MKIILLWDSTGRSAKVKKVSTHLFGGYYIHDKLNVEKSLPWKRSDRRGRPSALSSYSNINILKPSSSGKGGGGKL